MSGLKKLKKEELLFKEGDDAHAMYVIKSGRLAVLKSKGSSDVVLAELGPGDMLGEMGFFDNKPRSASAKALVDSEVIELPFSALNAQFKTFPEWLKAIVRTVNSHLRNANQKIKNLERSAEEETTAFPPHMITKLASILAAVGKSYGEVDPAGVSVPPGTLRRWTIQVFQQPTNKMQIFMENLTSLGHMTIEDLGEGRTRLVVKDLDFILSFVDFYNDWIYKDESKRVTIDERELSVLEILIRYAEKNVPLEKDKGLHRVNLTQVQASCQAEMGRAFSVDDVNSLSDKKVLSVKFADESGIAVTLELKELKRLLPLWTIVYTLKRIKQVK